MKSNSESLLELLEEIHRLYGRLETLLKAEKLALLKNSLDEIVECGKKKENITRRLSALEESRIKLISFVSREKGSPESRIDLTFLSRDPDTVIALRFGKIKSLLTPLLRRVGQMNAENSSFIEEAMRGVLATFTFFSGITSGQKTYRGSGDYAVQKNGTTGKVFYKQV